MTGYALKLYDNPVRTGQKAGALAFLGIVTDRLPDWRCSVRDIWGCHQATGTYQGSELDKLRLFMRGIGCLIRLSEGGYDWAEYQITKMELDHRGVTFVRDMSGQANRCRTIYSKIGPNLFTNGSAESGVWGSVGTPTTIETTTTWFTNGTQGMHVVHPNDTDVAGAEIESGVAISANRAYQCRVTIEVISGVWTLRITDGTNVLAQSSTASGATGREVLQARLTEDNTETSVTVELVSETENAEVYADAAVLQLAPFRAETEWFSTDNSIAEYGRLEAIFLEGGLTDAQAEGLARKELANRAWPFARPAGSGESTGVPATDETRLRLTCAGLAWTLSWRHVTTTGGEAAGSTLVTNVIGEAELVSAGYIQPNSATFKVEDANPVTLWSALADVAEGGDGAGARWMLGCYPDRALNYHSRPSTVDYEIRNGILRHNGGAIVKPWHLRPGWCKMSDMPPEPNYVGGGVTDDPAVVWLEEFEFRAPDTIQWRVESTL